MKKIIIILILFLAAVFLSVSIQGNVENTSEKNQTGFVTINNVRIYVEIMGTPEARARGLSGKHGLGEHEGMLFIFDTPDKYSFWMKDMNFPIDIIWVDENLKIVHIEDSISPDTYPTSFSPNTDSKYVLEVTANFTEEQKIKINDKMVINPGI